VTQPGLAAQQSVSVAAGDEQLRLAALASRLLLHLPARLVLWRLDSPPPAADLDRAVKEGTHREKVLGVGHKPEPAVPVADQRSEACQGFGAGTPVDPDAAFLAVQKAVVGAAPNVFAAARAYFPARVVTLGDRWRGIFIAKWRPLRVADRSWPAFSRATAK
jgi:hypothetical protein